MSKNFLPVFTLDLGGKLEGRPVDICRGPFFGDNVQGDNLTKIKTSV